MPYTKVIKVSDKVYERLADLADSMRVKYINSIFPRNIGREYGRVYR
jgi:hypothetical protein